MNFRWVYFFAFINIFFLCSDFDAFGKKVLIGFGQTGDHKTPRTNWVSTCIKILKEMYTRGLVILNLASKIEFFGKIFTRAQVVVQSTVVQGSLGTGSLGTGSLGTAVLGQ